ncbi:MAG: hypothetical protein KDK23_02840 [Leptospiraceae bacterium]|nr:hypothetical protein [Leptospiraceae bacterium]
MISTGRIRIMTDCRGSLALFAMAFAFVLAGCKSQPITYQEFQRGNQGDKSLVYFTLVCRADATVKLWPRIRGEGTIQIDCERDKPLFLSYALGEGIYSLSAWNFNDSFRWPEHTFEVGNSDERKVYYWGRITVTVLNPMANGVTVEQNEEDLRKITEETGIPVKAIEVSFVRE